MAEKGLGPILQPPFQGSVYHALLSRRETKPLPLGRSVLAMDGATAAPAQAAFTQQISVHLKQAGPSKQGRKGFPVQDSDPKNWSLHSSPKY